MFEVKHEQKAIEEPQLPVNVDSPKKDVQEEKVTNEGFIPEEEWQK